MAVLNRLVNVFLLPGTIVLNAIGITIEEDGGIFRSMINMLFWGALAIPIVLVLSL